MNSALPVALLVAYPVTIHLLITSGRGTLAVAVLLVTAIASSLAAWRARRRPAVLIALALSAAGLVSLSVSNAVALYVPPVAINVALMIVFARSLAAGRVPLIERAIAQAQTEPGQLPESQRRLARAFTGFWAAFFACAAVGAALLAVFAPLAVWSLFTNVVYFVLVGVLVATQHQYRVWRGGRRYAGSLRLLGSRLLRHG